MPVRTSGFLAIVALLILPTAVTSAGPAMVNGPLLAPGDTWTYRTNTSLATGLILDGRVTLTVIARASSAVEDRMYDSYVMSVSGSIDPGSERRGPRLSLLATRAEPVEACLEPAAHPSTSSGQCRACVVPQAS